MNLQADYPRRVLF